MTFFVPVGERSKDELVALKKDVAKMNAALGK